MSISLVHSFVMGDPRLCFHFGFETILSTSVGIVLCELDLKPFAGLEYSVRCLVHARQYGMTSLVLHEYHVPIGQEFLKLTPYLAETAFARKPADGPQPPDGASRS
jgi:hypothetical protein